LAWHLGVSGVGLLLLSSQLKEISDLCLQMKILPGHYLREQGLSPQLGNRSFLRKMKINNYRDWFSFTGCEGSMWNIS
jgi:hypothetical protein